MITIVVSVYAELLNHYEKKWKNDRIDKNYQDWEDGQEMRKDFGYESRNFQRIPKRKIKNNAARKRHAKLTNA